MGKMTPSKPHENKLMVYLKNNNLNVYIKYYTSYMERRQDLAIHTFSRLDNLRGIPTKSSEKERMVQEFHTSPGDSVSTK